MISFQSIFILSVIALIQGAYVQQSVYGELPIYNQDLNGQYSYGYNSGNLAKQETRRPDGVIRGSYSYVGADGKLQTVEYVADDVNGFQVIDTTLPQAQHLINNTPVKKEQKPQAANNEKYPYSVNQQKPIIDEETKGPKVGNKNEPGYYYHKQQQNMQQKQQNVQQQQQNVQQQQQNVQQQQQQKPNVQQQQQNAPKQQDYMQLQQQQPHVPGKLEGIQIVVPSVYGGLGVPYGGFGLSYGPYGFPYNLYGFPQFEPYRSPYYYSPLKEMEPNQFSPMNSRPSPLWPNKNQINSPLPVQGEIWPNNQQINSSPSVPQGPWLNNQPVPVPTPSVFWPNNNQSNSPNASAQYWPTNQPSNPSVGSPETSNNQSSPPVTSSESWPTNNNNCNPISSYPTKQPEWNQKGK